MAGWHIASVAVKAFKSCGPAWTTFDVPPLAPLVGIVGANGAGKSVLLEAICFACGGSPSLLRLPGGSLKGVTATDAGSQLPEVRLTLRRGQAEQHVLQASITPEGGRAYRVDGRARTGTQVKELLKGCGIVVDETTVIQQAAVTRLSDNNSAAALAHLVGSASRLNTWNTETAAARAEVARTQAALRSIEDNIARVEASTAADDAAMRKAAEAAQLECELEATLQQLLTGLQAQRQQLEQQVEASHAEQRELQDSEAGAAERLQQLLAAQEQLATQAQVLEGHGGDSTAAGSGTASSSLLQRIAAAEAQAAALEAAATSRAALRAEVQAAQQQLREQEASVQRLQHSLACKQRDAAQLASNLAAGRATTDAAASVKQQLQEASRQAAAAAAAVTQQKAEVAARQAQVQQLQSTLLEAQQASPAATPDSEQAAAAAAAAAATAQQHLASLQQQLLRLQMDAEAAARPLTSPSTASLLASLGPAAEARPLHQCFRIRSASGPPATAAAAGNLGAANLEQLLTPLSVIAGPGMLQTLVVPSLAHANRLLAAAAAGGGGGGSHGRSNKLKIWPLDRLSPAASNVQHRRRAAQQELGRQAVLLPLDLLEYDAACEAALLRAFGGLVVAAEDATAAALVQRFGLSAVTLQGTVSRKGSMSGGFTGSSGSQARAFWASKLQHDAAAARRSACEQQLAAAQQHQQAAEAQRFAAEQRLAAAKQQQALQSELSEATGAWQQEQQQLEELQARQAAWQQRLEQCRAAGGGSATKEAAAALCDELQAAAEAAAAAATVAAQELEAAQDAVDELAAAAEALDCRLAAMQAPEQQQEQQLHACRQQLAELQQQQASEASAAAQRQELLRELEGQRQQLVQQVKAAQQQCDSIRERAAEAAAAGRAAAAAVKAATKELSRLQRDFADAQAVAEFARRPAAAAATTDDEAAVAVSEAQLARLSRAVKQLKAKLDTLDVPELPPGQKEAGAARLAQVARFRQQAEALRSAAAALEQHVSSGAEQVAGANDAVYEDVAVGFSALCASLLPSLELQLVRTASLAHEGLQIRFRRRPDGSSAEASAAGPGDARDEWQHSLGQLSGGQRTLVSLAMLLAVARAGGSSTGLLLLDEVDAALDEHNTARAAALLRQLAHGGCQVLCVTHNAAFQGCCDGFIRVAKAAGGRTVPAGGEAEGAVGTSGNAQQQQRGRQAGSVAGPAPAGGTGGGEAAAAVGKGAGPSGCASPPPDWHAVVRCGGRVGEHTGQRGQHQRTG